MNIKCISVVALAAVCSVASAYIPVMLHSELVPGIESAAYGVGDGQQVGTANPFNPNPRALLWNGSAKSMIELTPTGYTRSEVFAVQAGKQYGYAFNSSLQQNHPLIWNSSSSDYLSIFVPNLGGHNFQHNGIQDASANEQVGWAIPYAAPKNNFDPGARAMMWQGSAASAILLHPDHLGVVWSIAYGTDATQQVGWGLGTVAGGQIAILWEGTAESAVNLTPMGALQATASAVSGGQQVGTVSFGPGPRAALWHGSASSFIDLNPEFADASFATDTNGVSQVGFYSSTQFIGAHAVRWAGSAVSYEDLHDYLPPEWDAFESVAHGIDTNGNIVGAIHDSQGWKAVMWVVPEPGTIAALAAGLGLLIARRRRRNATS